MTRPRRGALLFLAAASQWQASNAADALSSLVSARQSVAPPPQQPAMVDGAAPDDFERMEVVTQLFQRTKAGTTEEGQGLTRSAITDSRGGAAVADSPARKGPVSMEKLKVLSYFGLWYVLNVWYNIVNKSVLNKLPLPWTVATAQLGIGGAWVSLQWLLRLREAPELSPKDAVAILPAASFHGGGQLATVLSLGAGAVSFTHVVKALEPFFSALVSAVWLKQVFRPQVYAALVPVVAGVGIACFAEVSFSWLSFAAAMLSNLMFACRAVFSKALMAAPSNTSSSSGRNRGVGRKMSAANLYGVLTIAAFVLTAPLAAIAEGAKVGKVWDASCGGTAAGAKALGIAVLLSGLSHYLNNEVMYLALDNVHPVTLAVGNTMKRVFIIVASLVVFKNPVTAIGAIGSAIGIAGVLLYSLARQHYG